MDQAANEVYDFIFKLDRRIGYLEKDIAFIEKKISTLDVYKTKMYENLREELSAAKINIDDIRIKLKNISIGIHTLSSDMKDVIKKEQSVALAKQVDELPLNDYLTRTEFKNM
jgi:predicted  nucleic acid-binding Zn-ribbon protein